MSKRTKARFKAYRQKQEKAKLRLVAVSPMIKPTWTAPAVRELVGVEAIIRRAYARFSPDHPCHEREPDYAPDYTSGGARVLTWVPPAIEVELREAA